MFGGGGGGGGNWSLGLGEIPLNETQVCVCVDSPIFLFFLLGGWLVEVASAWIYLLCT